MHKLDESQVAKFFNSTKERKWPGCVGVCANQKRNGMMVRVKTCQHLWNPLKSQFFGEWTSTKLMNFDVHDQVLCKPLRPGERKGPCEGLRVQEAQQAPFLLFGIVLLIWQSLGVDTICIICIICKICIVCIICIICTICIICRISIICKICTMCIICMPHTLRVSWPSVTLNRFWGYSCCNGFVF